MAATERPSRADAATQWSLVAAAGDQDPGAARASLVALCLRYWYPVHAYLRRSGQDPEPAHALALAFFRHLLSVDPAGAAVRGQARFRQFLLAELDRFVSARTAPGMELADVAAAPPDLPVPPLAGLEARLRAEAVPGRSPEQLLQRGFALEVLGGALDRLRDEARRSGRTALFDALARFLGRPPGPGDHAQVADALGLRPVQVAVAVRGLRERFRALVDAELSDILADAGQLDAEREALMQALTDAPS